MPVTKVRIPWLIVNIAMPKFYRRNKTLVKCFKRSNSQHKVFSISQLILHLLVFLCPGNIFRFLFSTDFKFKSKISKLTPYYIPFSFLLFQGYYEIKISFSDIHSLNGFDDTYQQIIGGWLRNVHSTTIIMNSFPTVWIDCIIRYIREIMSCCCNFHVGNIIDLLNDIRKSHENIGFYSFSYVYRKATKRKQKSRGDLPVPKRKIKNLKLGISNGS